MRRMHTIYVCLFSLVMTACTLTSTSAPVTTGSILVYSTLGISEEASNDGTFDSTIDITLTGSEFNSSLVEGTDFGTEDLPDGLTATLTVNSSTTATLTIAGVATDHSFCNDTDMTFFFNSSAFTDNLLPIGFDAPIAISWFTPTLEISSTLVSEDDGNNDGSVADTLTITAHGGGQFLHDGSPTSNGTFLTLDTDYTWDVPAGLIPILDPDAANPDTVLNVSFLGAATESSPVFDAESTLKFISGEGISSDYCSNDLKKKIDFEFVRTIIMYSVAGQTGDLNGQSGADALCYVNRPELPVDYVNFKAFLSFDGAHEIRDLDSLTPAGQEIEGESGTVIALDFSDLIADMAGELQQTITDAGVSSTAYWTGSQTDGSVSADNCNGFDSATIAFDGAVGAPASLDQDWLDDGAPIACNSTDNAILCVAFTN